MLLEAVTKRLGASPPPRRLLLCALGLLLEVGPCRVHLRCASFRCHPARGCRPVAQCNSLLTPAGPAPPAGVPGHGALAPFCRHRDGQPAGAAAAAGAAAKGSARGPALGPGRVSRAAAAGHPLRSLVTFHSPSLLHAWRLRCPSHDSSFACHVPSVQGVHNLAAADAAGLNSLLIDWLTGTLAASAAANDSVASASSGEGGGTVREHPQGLPPGQQLMLLQQQLLALLRQSGSYSIAARDLRALLQLLRTSPEGRPPPHAAALLEVRRRAESKLQAAGAPK